MGNRVSNVEPACFILLQAGCVERSDCVKNEGKVTHSNPIRSETGG